MKAQMSFVIKPIMLVAMILLILILIFSFYTSEVKEKEREKSLDLTATATNILLLLANSEDCLAFRAEDTKGTYANLVSKEKLDIFSKLYSDIEPECARSFDFGWRATIEELDKDGKVVNTWSFGAKEFSEKKKENINFWMPIAIRYSSKRINPGKMYVSIVYGELESFAGFLDLACSLRREQKAAIAFEETMRIEGNRLCVRNACRELFCEIIGPKEISPGNYIITTAFSQPKKLFVSI
ncbi:MAG: hypothetical protein QXQ40_00635 [Candidatus Aenigmatarchaeota archaeon]